MLTPEQAHIRSFRVVPALPEPLKPLLEIAQNLWWTWHPEAVGLFWRIDRDLWQSTRHNPIALLGRCAQHRLDELAADDAYVGCIQRLHEQMQAHMSRRSWFHRQHSDAHDCCIAYFSAEFGLTESLQVYSGGLGILAGDHLKSASELGLPLVGVGLLYRRGYFQQYLNVDGWQQEFYPDLDFANLPVKRVRDETGGPLTVEVALPGRAVQIAVWETTVGRIRLLLLDTNLRDNDPADRAITAQLYGGDMETRIKQEIVLGIGGVRALAAMGIEPTVFHMNEGHAAFLGLERIRRLVEQHEVSFDEARWAAASGNVFTTHTPVPAGIDRFPPDMIQRYFKDYHGGLKLDIEGLLALGRENVFDKSEFFSMAVLALRTSDGANGVSKLHGNISRNMWGKIWPDVPAEEIPIGHVTNGVHTRSWISADMTNLFDRYISNRWQTNAEDQSVWDGVGSISDEELWRVHEMRRHRLVAWVRQSLQRQLEQRGASSPEIEAASQVFDGSALTIGFARRFATYKRANMLFRDVARLGRILNDADRPVQIIVAGKAHPADAQGKELIREIVHFAREGAEGTGVRRVAFVENYDMNVARYLVQGCDVWLNTPRRGMEASGTSGMKAAVNGVLNLSIPDGWWDEAWGKDRGWVIGSGETYSNYDYQDEVESHALYDLLEKQVVPMFYDRGTYDLPRRWIGCMKNSMQQFIPRFNTNRMVQEYAEQYYLPAHRRHTALTGEDLAGARELARFKDQLRQHWTKVTVELVDADTTEPLGVGRALDISADVHLGALEPDMVRVQVFSGPLDAETRLTHGNSTDMAHAEDLGDGRHRYSGTITADNSGNFGFAVRVIPGSANLASPFVPGLIVWDREEAPALPKQTAPRPVPAAAT